MVLIFLVYIYSLNIFAQNIKVYGGFNEQSYYDANDTTTIIDSSDFNVLEAFHTEDLVDLVPNMSSAKGSSRASFFQIRGIGERSSYEAVSNYSVGTLIDDIDYTGLGLLGLLSGVDQVEVYRGPQGTRFGPSALAGMMHMRTSRALEDTNTKVNFKLDSTVGNYGLLNNSFLYTEALKSGWGVTINLFNNQSDGFIENSFLNRDDTNHINEKGVKLFFEKEKNNSKTDIAVHFFSTRNGYDAFVQNNSLVTRSDRVGKDKLDSMATSFKHKRKMNNFLSFVSILSFLKSDQSYSYDEDWGNHIQWQNLPGWNTDYDYNIVFERKREDLAFDQRFLWGESLIAGIYLKNQTEDFSEVGFQNGSIRKNISGKVKTRLGSFYFDKNLSLSSKWSLSLGGRAEYRDTRYSDIFSNQLNTDDWLYGINSVLSYEVSPKEKVLFKLAKGYKAGGFNTQEDVDLGRKEFRGEDLYSLEIGHKKYWKQIRIVSNINLFAMLRDNAQVRTSFQDDPMDPSSYTFYTDNATSGIHYGAELELEKNFSNSLSLRSSLALLKTEYKKYEVGGLNLKGREMPYAPEYSGFVLLDYKVNDLISFSGNLKFSDNFYFSNSHGLKSNPYQIVDIQARYNKDNWEVRLWCKNIFNELRTRRGFFFSNEPPDFDDELYIQRDAPRTYGASFVIKF